MQTATEGTITWRPPTLRCISKQTFELILDQQRMTELRHTCRLSVLLFPERAYWNTAAILAIEKTKSVKIMPRYGLFLQRGVWDWASGAPWHASGFCGGGSQRREEKQVGCSIYLSSKHRICNTTHKQITKFSSRLYTVLCKSFRYMWQNYIMKHISWTLSVYLHNKTTIRLNINDIQTIFCIVICPLHISIASLMSVYTYYPTVGLIQCWMMFNYVNSLQN